MGDGSASESPTLESPSDGHEAPCRRSPTRRLWSFEKLEARVLLAGGGNPSTDPIIVLDPSGSGTQVVNLGSTENLQEYELVTPISGQVTLDITIDSMNDDPASIDVVFDNSRNVIAENFPVFEATAGQTYFVEFNGSLNGQYTLNVSTQPVPPAIVVLSNGSGTQTGSTGPDHQADQYNFTDPISGLVSISLLQPYPDIPLDFVDVLDSTGNSVISNVSDFGDEFTFTAVAGQNYVVQIEETTLMERRYTLNFTTTPIVPAITLATDGTGGVSGNITTQGQVDNYELIPPFSGQIKINLSQNPSTTPLDVVSLLDGSGNPVPVSSTTALSSTYRVVSGQTYDVRVTANAPVAHTYNIYCSTVPEIPLTPDGSGTQSGNTVLFSNAVYYSLVPPISGQLTIKVAGTTASSTPDQVSLLDSAGNPVVADGSLYRVVAGQAYSIGVVGESISSQFTLTLTTQADDFGNDPATAKSLTLRPGTTIQNGQINYPDDLDIFQVVAPTNGLLSASLTRNGVSGYVTISDANNVPIASNDPLIRGLTSENLSGVVVGAGQTYLISVRGTGSRTGAYSLALGLAPSDLRPTSPPDNTLATATRLALGMTGTGTVAPGGADLFRIDPTTTGRLVAQVLSKTSGLRLTLRDASGQAIVQSDGQSLSLQDGGLALHVGPGIYYLEVSGAGGSGTYRLSTGFSPATPPVQPDQITNNLAGAALTLAQGDFNGDGIPDLINANGVYLGLGDGTFRKPEPSAAIAREPGDLTTIDNLTFAGGDFNGDGKLDVAILNKGIDDNNPTVSVLAGRGDGTFGASIPITLNFLPLSILAAPFGKHGVSDLLVTDANGVSVLAVGPDGRFGPAVRYGAGLEPISPVVGDFTGDGKLDLAFVTLDPSDIPPNASMDVLSSLEHRDVVVLPGQGDGTFLAPVVTGYSQPINSILAGDFTGDHRLDLLTMKDDSSSSTGTLLVVLPGQGHGKFGTAIESANTAEGAPILAGTFTASGHLDLVEQTNNGFFLVPGRGNGTFGVPIVATSEGRNSTIVAGDFNGDHRLDLAIGGDVPAILESQGNGAFIDEAGGLSTSVSAVRTIVGDFNGDGKLDVVTDVQGQIRVSFGLGDGNFGDPIVTTIGSPFYGAPAIAMGDFNGDQRADLVVAEGSRIEVLLGKGDGTFATPMFFTSGLTSPTSIVTGDFNNDGKIDLAVGDLGTLAYFGTAGDANLAVLLGQGNGTFDAPKVFETGVDPIALVAADFNGDGKLDIATIDLKRSSSSLYPQSTLLFYPGQNDGTFGPPVATILQSPLQSLVAEDFNGDGRLDLAGVDSLSGLVPAFSPAGLYVLTGDGHGHFHESAKITAGIQPQDLVVGDFNGDGRPDLATTGTGGELVQYQDDINVFFGRGDGSFTPALDTGRLTNPNSIASGDFNGDGTTDLIIGDYGTVPLSTLLSLGDKTLADPTQVVTTPHATPVLADLDGDGITDVLVIDQAGDILWRRGQAGRPGSFDPPLTINPGIPARDLTVVTLDSRVTVAAVDAKDAFLSLYADINGQFVRVGALPTGLLPAQVRTGDLTGAGYPDLIVRNAGVGTLSIFLGGPGGTFTARPPLAIGLGISDLAVAELDRADILLTDRATGKVVVLPGLGNAFFGPPRPYLAGHGLHTASSAAQGSGTAALTTLEATAGIAVVPSGAGGLTALLAINPGSNTFAVLAGISGDRFANPFIQNTTTPAQFLRVADVNNDGIPDAITLESGQIEVYLGLADGHFSTKPLPANAGEDPTGLTVRDLNGDGKPDLIIGNSFGDVLLLLGNGNGTFRPFQLASRNIALAATDLKGTGTTDFIFANQGLDHVSVQYHGSAAPTVLAGPGQGVLAPGAVALIDVGNGLKDLVVANSGSNNVLVYPVLSNGQFGPALHGGQGFFTGTNPVGLTVADVNNDGIPDLVVANQGSNDVSVLLGQGVGKDYTLVPHERLKVGTGPTATAVTKLPGAANPSILVSDGGSNDVRLLPGVGQGFFVDNPSQTKVFGVGTDPIGVMIIHPGGPSNPPGAVSINAGSNSLTMIPLSPEGGSPTTIGSGGTDPTTGMVITPTEGGPSGLLVANNGDGRIALFLSGPDGLELAQTIENPDLPHPTSLALGTITGDVLTFYADTEGIEVARSLSVSLRAPDEPGGLPGGGNNGNGGEKGGGGNNGEGSENEGGGGIGSLPELPGGSSGALPMPSVVPRFQPLNGSSLAVIATLFSVIEETGSGGSSGSGEAAASGSGVALAVATSALPNQPILGADAEGSGRTDPETPPGPIPTDPATNPLLSPLARLVFGLDEAFQKARTESRRSTLAIRSGLGTASRTIPVVEAAFTRWSPVVAAIGPSASGMVHGLGPLRGVATRVIDAALHALTTGEARDQPAATVIPADEKPDGPSVRSRGPAIEAIVALGLATAVIARVAPGHRRRSGTAPARRGPRGFPSSDG